MCFFQIILYNRTAGCFRVLFGTEGTGREMKPDIEFSGAAMKLFMKKINSLLLLLIVTALFLSGCSGTALFAKPGLKPMRFSQFSILGGSGNTSTFSDENEIAYYVEAINSAEVMKQDISNGSLAEYRVLLEGKKPKHTREFTLYLDENLENRNLFIRLDKELRKIGDGYFDDFLRKPVFDPVYPNRLPPQVTLKYDSRQFELQPDDCRWNFRKTDMKYYESNVKQPGANGDIGLVLTEAGGLPSILTTDEPDSVRWTFLQEGKEVLSLNETPADPLPLADGTYGCLLELQWLENQNRGFFGEAQYAFDLQVDNPPEIGISSLKTSPGELLVITASHVNADEEVAVQTEFDFEPNVFTQGADRVILLPVSYYHEPNKTYSIQVSAGDVSETFQVEVLDKEFAIQQLTIDPKVAAATRNDESAREVKEKIDPLRPVCDEEKYWEGAFIQPVDGGRVRPADFGKRRYVNNAPTSYRHNGLDIAHNQGEPVKAANHGRVLFADYMIGTGNTVIIEHGYGLKSWYYHMVSLDAKAGDMVKKGDVIGLVGSTGFSTGPHLHFAISVNDVYVNPMPFFEEGVPLLEKK